MLSVETAVSQDRWVSETVERESSRLRNFIARRVEDAAEADDILQDVFYELVAAARMTEPIERVGAWLFRVARNRIIDRFRKKRFVTFGEAVVVGENGETPRLDELLPSPDAGPEAAYARTLLLAELQNALGELPVGQREAFIAHEIEGRPFSEIATQTGVSVNALILRKHQAVLFFEKAAARDPRLSGGNVRTTKMNENPNDDVREKEMASWLRSRHSRTRKHMRLKFVAIAVLGIPLFGLAVMLLWNWLAPAVFGLHSIGFLQALGILALSGSVCCACRSRILFGGFHGRPRGGFRGDRRMLERWEKMTPEERQNMMEVLHAARQHHEPV